MRISICLFALVILSAITSACRDDNAAAYLQGQNLKERVEVFDLQGGFAGFSGRYYVIEPDGAWIAGRIQPPAQKKSDPTASGKLSNEQLRQFAALLAQHDLVTLPNLGKSTPNPRIIRIQYGSRVSELQPGREGSDQEEYTKTRSRYEGILNEFKRLSQAP